MRRGTGFQPVGLAGVSPASRDPAGSPQRVRPAADRMPAGPTARMAVLPNLEPAAGHRTSESHRHLIGAVLGTRFAHFIGERGVPLSAGVIGIGAIVRYRRHHYSIAVDVDVGRGYWRPCEIHRVPAP